MTDDPYDELDRGLLHAVHLDARAPFRRLGEALGVSDQTVARPTPGGGRAARCGARR